MKNQNYHTLNFFLSSYRIDDMEQRRVLVTENFGFTTPVVGTLNFNEFHQYNSVIRNHTEHQIENIEQIDPQNFIIKMKHLVVENSSNYVKEILVKTHVTFVDNLIDSVWVEYEADDHDNKILKKILAPFTHPDE